KFLWRQARVLFGRVIEPAPSQYPEKTETSGHQENRTPTARQLVGIQGQKRSDRPANRRAAVKHRDRPCPLFIREPLRGDLGSARPVGTFPCAEQEAKEAEAGKPLRQR